MKQRAQGPPSSFECGEENSLGWGFFSSLIISIFPYLNGIPTFGMEDLGNVTFWGQKFGGLSDKCSKIIHLNKV
jgi:hypothetical protein